MQKYTNNNSQIIYIYTSCLIMQVKQIYNNYNRVYISIGLC